MKHFRWFMIGLILGFGTGTGTTFLILSLNKQSPQPRPRVSAVPSTEWGWSYVTSRLLNAVQEVESGGNPDAVGKLGERGLFQIREETWKDNAKGVPWSQAFDVVANTEVARNYLVWIEQTLRKWMGRQPTVEQMIAAYNGGIGRLRQANYDVSKMPKSTQEYVSKVLQRMEQW